MKRTELIRFLWYSSLQSDDITAEQKKARVRGKKCNARTMMHNEAGEDHKMNAPFYYL
jgi:hypothetical protein